MNGVVSMTLAAYVVVPEAFLVVLSGVVLGAQPSSTYTSTMTWRSCWVEPGSGDRVGVGWMVWYGS
jgi:hypothetical protein